jgi:hypothetical protein
MLQRSKRTILFLITVLCLAVSVLFTETLYASELDHDCTGTDCIICLHIGAGASFLKTLKPNDGFLSLTEHPPFRYLTAEKIDSDSHSPTPIALKVRSNT